ncbi:MAG TPA: hypothetical protein VJR89_30285 [Polyangiales bacterium]|nr:hypothetical protein [Polyangiales bacterium]
MLPPACCADQATSTCGTVSGATCLPPPPAAPNCPTAALGGITFRTCCIADTQLCGIDASSIGMGCVPIGNIPGLDADIPKTRCDGTRVP